jgi:hypothetical protein
LKIWKDKDNKLNFGIISKKLMINGMLQLVLLIQMPEAMKILLKISVFVIIIHIQ